MTPQRLIGTLTLTFCAANISLAQDVKFNPPAGPLFNVNATTGNNLRINTTKLSWFYQFAGIKSITPGFSFTNCTPEDNGYCLFPVSDTAPINLTVVGSPGNSSILPIISVCLNGVGDTYSCEKHNIWAALLYSVVGNVYSGLGFFTGLGYTSSSTQFWRKTATNWPACTNIGSNSLVNSIPPNTNTQITRVPGGNAPGLCYSVCDISGQLCTNWVHSV